MRRGALLAVSRLPIRESSPYVAIVDIRMPRGYGSEGLQAAAEIRRELPSVGVLILSQYVEEHQVQLMSSGTEGVGYLLKDRVADVDRFVDAVRRVAEGGPVLDPQVVAEGLTNREISARMFPSERAIERHATLMDQRRSKPCVRLPHRRLS